MSVLVVGSVALDSVETPSGRVDEALGGSATYFAIAASLYGDVRLVAVVGDDFPRAAEALLGERGVDLRGLQRRPGRTFRWAGRYEEDLNSAITLDTQLNVFGTFQPTIPSDFADSRIVFLANIDPTLQLRVLEQVREPALTAMDTMNFWIQGKRDELVRVIRRVDVVMINEAELRQLTGRRMLFDAAEAVLELGPRVVVVKKGEYGSALFARDDYCAVPAFPVRAVRDPTGAGDSFAGAFIGALARAPAIDAAAMRRAVAHGSVVASFTVEEFSVNRLAAIRPADVDRRYAELRRVTAF